MPSHPDLFETTEAHARRKDPHTSHEAAEAVKLTNIESRVAGAFQYLYPRGGTTDDIARLLKIDLQSITPRIAPLLRKGYIERRIDPETDKPFTASSKSSTRSRIVHWWVQR